MIWNDEFDGSALDFSKWNYRAVGKRAQAFMTKNAVVLDGKGHLVIQVTRSGDSIKAGMISTENLFAVQYGYFECRARLTTTKGAFPAFWLQSPRISDESLNTEKSGAEIDIFEYFPHAKKDSVAHTLHYGGYGPQHRVAGPVWGALRKTADSFHTFGLEWTPASYRTFVDGNETFSGRQLISAIPEFIVLSVEVNTAAAGPLDVRNLPDSFIVDYVRVYQNPKTLAR